MFPTTTWRARLSLGRRRAAGRRAPRSSRGARASTSTPRGCPPRRSGRPRAARRRRRSCRRRGRGSRRAAPPPGSSRPGRRLTAPPRASGRRSRALDLGWLPAENARAAACLPLREGRVQHVRCESDCVPVAPRTRRGRERTLAEGGTEDSGEPRKQLPLFSTTELERDAEGRWPKRWVMDDRGRTVCSLCRQAGHPRGTTRA
jgi:hypothetical protein